MDNAGESDNVIVFSQEVRFGFKYYTLRTFILLFSDDNIMMDRDYSLSLFQKVVEFGLLNPTQGTDVYDRMEREGRLLFTDFPSSHALYDLNRAVFTPMTMPTQEMEAGLDSTTRQICNWPVATRRAVHTWRNSNNLSAALISLFWTRLGLHNRVFGGRT